jgi:hypothetical protein
MSERAPAPIQGGGYPSQGAESGYTNKEALLNLEARAREKYGGLVQMPDSITFIVPAGTSGKRAVIPDPLGMLSKLGDITGDDVSFVVDGDLDLEDVTGYARSLVIVSREVVYKSDESTPRQTDKPIFQKFANLDGTVKDFKFDPGKLDSEYIDSPHIVRIPSLYMMLGQNAGIVANREETDRVELKMNSPFVMPYAEAYRLIYGNPHWDPSDYEDHGKGERDENRRRIEQVEREMEEVRQSRQYRTVR